MGQSVDYRVQLLFDAASTDGTLLGELEMLVPKPRKSKKTVLDDHIYT